MNRQIMKAMFPKAIENIDNGKCGLCDKDIDEETEFRDEESKKEFKISGLCQQCQDEIYGN